MSKIEPIGNWNARAALASMMERIQGKESAQILILFRDEDTHRFGFRSANITNQQSLFLVEEFKHSLFNDCHECKCQQNED